METTTTPARTTFFVDETNGTFYGSSQREIAYGYRVTPHLMVVHVRHDGPSRSTAIVRRTF